MPDAAHRRPVAAALLAAAAAAHGVPLTVTVTDEAGRPLADAAVSLSVKGLPARAAPGAAAEIVQKDKQFRPFVTVVQTGTAVSFPNQDTVRHHVYSFAPIRSFELKLYSGTPASPVVFDKPGTAALGCNIHDRMAAWVHVVDTPIFAKTDAQGLATLDAPPGQHLLRAWHPGLPEAALPAEQPVGVEGPAARAAVRLAVAAP